RAVDGVTLTVAAGTSVAITGSSGSGKSTLLGLIAGLETPTCGRVTIGGEALSQLPERARARLRRRQLGLVFQSDNLQPFLSALENVGLQRALCSGPNADERCLELLVELGLGDEAGKLPDQLSGGQRQRVAIARALIVEPSILLLDEPTSALDASVQAEVLNLLEEIRRDRKLTFVMVSHDLGVVTHMCERLAVMRNGAVVERLSSQELAQGAVHEDYTRNLMIASKGFVKA
ncbi:MAG: ABC transporter ATP-binding protein, partial [Rhizobium sp.]|uniref:ABC transporter ATP-binding protein n=1 Tax=Rhizobium sp. TaxID=391 RepID=UPI00389AE3F6